MSFGLFEMDAAAAVEASAGMEAEGWLPQLNECAAQDGADRGNWKTHLLPLIKIKRERETSSFLSDGGQGVEFGASPISSPRPVHSRHRIPRIPLFFFSPSFTHVFVFFLSL